MQRLRFLSFNIHGGRGRDGQRNVRRVHDLMERFDIDVGVFQEMETRMSRGGMMSDVEDLAGASRPHRFLAPCLKEQAGCYGNLIVSRFPLLETRLHDLGTRFFFEPRNAIDAVIATPLGALRIVGTHLSLWLFQRWTEAQNLIRLMAEVEEKEKSPLLLMGDINEWQRPSFLLRFLDRIMTPIPCKGTFPAFCPILKLDRVWHDAHGLTVIAHRLDSHDVRILSDHLPLLVEVESKPKVN
jgi:endonuclease/exonuclease/phosphatase family metal-dependent hydrolase